MNEKLLQYIWKLQYFQLSRLCSIDGKQVEIQQPGIHNHNQGPDFLDARIRINGTRWAGHVELHVRSSDWALHGHGHDNNYKNVILHVVWDHDADLQLTFPTIELKNKVPKLLLERYSNLMMAPTYIPCDKFIGQVDTFTWTNWQHRLLVERLVEKSTLVSTFLTETKHHWEELCWWLLAKNFGGKINGAAFEKMARSLPLSVLAKHADRLLPLEALLLGQCNLLHGASNDEYMRQLQKEYLFLKKKYALPAIQVPVHFLRMRPSNFPSVRLAQLASLLHRKSHFFSSLLAADTAKEAAALLNVTAGPYWDHHYLPGEDSVFKKKKLGKQALDNILINTAIPLLFAYGHHRDDAIYMEKAIRWLEEVDAENNNITRVFELAGVQVKSAYDSQACIQLKNQYCNSKRCLECAVGNRILKQKPG